MGPLGTLAIPNEQTIKWDMSPRVLFHGPFFAKSEAFPRSSVSLPFAMDLLTQQDDLMQDLNLKEHWAMISETCANVILHQGF